MFWGGLTDLGLRLTVRDTQTGATRTYETAPGTMVSAADTSALPPSAQSAAFSAERLHSFALDREAFASEVDVAAPPARPRASSLPDSAAGPCSPPELPVVPRPGLCLAGNRFEVEATWRDFAGRTGVAEGVELGDDSGWFWFFDRDNVELVVKVLDGRAVNGRFWVFYGALTNVEYDLVVRNAATGATWTHHNPSGAFASGADVDALQPSAPYAARAIGCAACTTCSRCSPSPRRPAASSSPSPASCCSSPAAACSGSRSACSASSPATRRWSAGAAACRTRRPSSSPWRWASSA